MLEKLLHASANSRQEIGPTFIIVGAMKAGTGTLHTLLAAHPDVFMPKSKELHYWDRPKRGPLEDYLALFRNGCHCPARGETTPSYAFQPAVAELLANFDPNLRLIFIMRDPVKRAISHLRHAARRSGHPETFDVMRELRAEIAELPLREGKSFVALQRTYHARGHYHQQISRLRRYFPEKQLLLMTLENLTADPDGETRRLCDFIGVGPCSLSLPHKNEGRRGPRISAEVTEYLAHYYRLHNEALQYEFGLSIENWTR